MNARRPILLLCAALAVGVIPRTTNAQTPAASALEDARQHYKRGIDLYGEGNYTAALIEFRRAYEIAPNVMILYNVAQVHYQLHEYPQALKAFETYLQDGGSKVPAARRSEVDKLIAYLRERVGYLDVKSNADGADVAVDGVSIGHTPFAAPVSVAVGRKRIDLLRNDHIVASKQIDIAAGDHVKVTIDEPPASAASVAAPEAGPREKTADVAPTPAETTAPPAATEERGPWAAVMWTVTGALAVGTGVTGVLTLGAAKDLKDKRQADGASRAELDSAQSKTKTLALVTDILGATTIVAAGAALYFTLSKPSHASTSAASVPLRIRIGASSAMLTGGF